MSRLTRISWWTLVLIFVLAFSSAAVVMPSGAVHASDYTIDDPNGGGSGGNTGFGDPDVPVGAAKELRPRSSGQRIVVGRAGAAGDGGALSDPRNWRLQTWVLLMRGFIFRF